MDQRVSRGLVIAVACATSLTFATCVTAGQERIGTVLLIAALFPVAIGFIALPTLIGWRIGVPNLGILAAINVLGGTFFGLGWIAAWLYLIYAAHRKKLADRAAPEGEAVCASCGTPYRPADYRSGAAVWACDRCGANLRDALASPT